MLKRNLFCCLFALLLATGCSSKTEKSGDSGNETPATKTAKESHSDKPVPQMSASDVKPITETTEDGSRIELYQETWADTQKFIASQKGKVVVVDFWATYCGPCKKEFPNLVKLHNDHGDKVVCVSFSLDYEGLDPIEDIVPDVMKFLKSKNATIRNVLCSEESDVFYEAEDLAGIPVVRVYGKDGKLAKQFEIDEDFNEFTYEKDVTPFVESLIKAE